MEARGGRGSPATPAAPRELVGEMMPRQEPMGIKLNPQPMGLKLENPELQHGSFIYFIILHRCINMYIYEYMHTKEKLPHYGILHFHTGTFGFIPMTSFSKHTKFHVTTSKVSSSLVSDTRNDFFLIFPVFHCR